MTDDELKLFADSLSAAKNDEERARVRDQWLPHMARCLISTNRHIKTMEETSRQSLDAIRGDIDAIGAKIDRLHRAPKWGEDKLGWLMANWLQLAVMAYLLKALGIELGPIVRALLGAF